MRVVTRVLTYLLLIHNLSDAQRIIENGTDAVETQVKVPHVVESRFCMYQEGDSLENTCTIIPFQSNTLDTCNFNSTNPLVIIIHGWSTNGLMESWVTRMASVLKSRLKDVNVVINDWLPLAWQYYHDAAQNTRLVGQDVATLLEWLENTTQFSMDKVHLIGYSLGAHASGFAGNLTRSRIGRITGLDPAGPLFEGVSCSDRLSPDDAVFVDAIHTSTQSHMGVSLGIKQPIGHLDFYPNSGSIQPGCFKMPTDFYGMIGDIHKTIKCGHERSVDLFIDSLLNEDKQSTAYRCRDDRAFHKGVCLDCKKNRCNTLGYSIRKVHTRASQRLYLKTRSLMPYRVYHYQVKIQLINQIEPEEATIFLSLNGTKAASQDLPITLLKEISGNKTYTSLITLDSDMGDLIVLKLRWEGVAGWKTPSSWWERIQLTMNGQLEQDSKLTVGKIRMKAGETQEKNWFCATSEDAIHLEPSQESVFVRCEAGHQRSQRRRRLPDSPPPTHIKI